jgi:hypothetical protein
MTNRSKSKGDRGELELAELLNEQLGGNVRRKLGAGRADDTGDLDNVERTTVQVKNYKDVMRAIREGLPGLEQQQANSGDDMAVLFVRRHGGQWVAIQTLEMWCATHREATA